MSGLSRLPDLIASHVLLAAAAMLLALALALPLGVWSARNRTVGRVALGFASLVQTIPSLALLALFYPVLLALSGLVGGGVPALGFLPSLLALTLYALLPMLRNIVAGLAGIDPAVREAADAVGMTAAQKLRLVEAPLAAPTVMAGIRTAAVWTIGAATLSTTVGYPSLGDLIFAGLQTQDWALVLTGCIAAAALALAADGLLGRIEHGLARRRRLLVWLGVALLLAGAALALAPRLVPRPPLVTIGAKNFSEQFILARLIGLRLERAGYRVAYRDGLGSTVAFRAVMAGDIDLSIDYSGTIWSNEMARRDNPPPAQMLAEIGRFVTDQHGARLVGALGFENAYAIAVRGADAKAAGLRSLDDLARAAPGLTFGADLEFLERPEWRAVQEAYGLRFQAQRTYTPTFMYRAIDSGDADAISAFSSDGRIAAQGLVVLTDPRRAIPSYDAILLVSPERARDRRFLAALEPLLGAISVERMRAANLSVDRDRDKHTPEQAAAWLDAQLR